MEWPTPPWNGSGHLEALTDTAWTCLDLNANILASMPPYLVGAAPSLGAAWMVNPDPDIYASWYEFAKALFWDFQMGEAFILTTARYSGPDGPGTGYPARFHVVPPWMVNIEAEAERGTRWRYTIGSVDVSADLLHVRYQGNVSDAHGHGPLEAGAGRVVAASALARYASNLAAAGGIPTSVLIHQGPERLTAEKAAELQSQWVLARSSSLGLPAVLSGGVDFKTLSFDPSQMALLDLSRWNESRIAVLLGVPPFLVGLPSGGDTMTYSNVEQLFDYHWRAGLRPRAEAVMQALSGWALPWGTTVELNRDAYVQPPPKERAETWEILTRIGVLTPAQVKAIERYSLGAPAPMLPTPIPEEVAA
jgi:HK97 family phage portal protein